jgi:hypothetical protein
VESLRRPSRALSQTLHTIEPTATALSAVSHPLPPNSLGILRDPPLAAVAPTLARSLLLGRSGRALDRRATENCRLDLPGLRWGSTAAPPFEPRAFVFSRLQILPRLHCFLTRASLFSYA